MARPRGTGQLSVAQQQFVLRLLLIRRRLSNKAIAARLGVSLTVIRNVFKRYAKEI